MSSCSLSMKSATRGRVVGVFFVSRVSMAECVDNGDVELGLRIDCVSSLCSDVDISGCNAAWVNV